MFPHILFIIIIIIIKAMQTRQEKMYYCQESSSKIQETATSATEQVKIDVRKVSSLIKCTLFVMCSSTDHLLQNQSQLL